MMRFDQITFQDKCFGITSGYNILKIPNFRNQSLRLAIMTACEIRSDSVLEHFGLSDVNDGAFLILHQITARQIG
ncbi:hypothetical protein D3C76_1214270 [compost metagenome]